MAWTFLMHDLKCYQENIYANGVMASAYICYLYTTMAIGDKYRQNIIDFFCFYLFWGTVKWYVWTDKIILAAILEWDKVKITSDKPSYSQFNPVWIFPPFLDEEIRQQMHHCTMMRFFKNFMEQHRTEKGVHFCNILAVHITHFEGFLR